MVKCLRKDKVAYYAFNGEEWKEEEYYVLVEMDTTTSSPIIYSSCQCGKIGGINYSCNNNRCCSQNGYCGTSLSIVVRDVNRNLENVTLLWLPLRQLLKKLRKQPLF